MIIAQPSPPLPAVTDPNFSNVVLLMGFEGPNQSVTTGMADESSKVHGTASNASSPNQCVSTTRHKYGGGSLHLNNSYIYFADHSDWTLGTSHFTIEMFIYETNVPSGTFIFLLSQFASSAPNLGWVFYIDATGHLGWNTSTTGSDNNADIVASVTVPASTWCHVCIDYNGSKYRVYQDGVMVGSFSTPRNIFNPSANLGIGGNSTGTFGFVGNMDEIRFTNGVARYASDGGFTPPTRAFPRS